jgi:hypothetical protein
MTGIENTAKNISNIFGWSFALPFFRIGIRKLV